MSDRALAAMVAIWIAAMSALAMADRHTMFDLGIHEQALWLCGQGLAPFLTTRGAWLQADHVSPVVWLLSPLGWIGPHALLVAQVALLGMGALPVYAMAREALESRALALGLAALYLLQPAVLSAALFDAHLNTLSCAFLLFALACRGPAYGVALALALSCAEFTGACVALMGLVMWREGERRRGLATCVVGAVALAASTIWLRFANDGQPSPYASLYAPVMADPLMALRLLTSPGALWAVMRLLLPTAGLAVVGWERLLPALPVVLGNLLSWRVLQHEMRAHYGVMAVPFVMWAAVRGLARLRPRLRVPALVAGSVLALGLAPAVEWASRVAPAVAADASVSADDALGAWLGDRARLYLFPNPFQPVAWGTSPQALADQSGLAIVPLSPLALRRASEGTDVEVVVLEPRPTVEMPMPMGDVSYYATLFDHDPAWRREGEAVRFTRVRRGPGPRAER